MKATDNSRAAIFAKNLTRLRLDRGKTRKEMAAALSITETSYGAYERAIRQPDFDRLFQLVQILDCSIVELLGDNPNAENLPVWKHRFDRALYLATWAGFEPAYSNGGKVTLKIKVDTDAGIETRSLDFDNPFSFIESIELAENYSLYHELTFKDAFMHFYNTGQFPLRMKPDSGCFRINRFEK